MDLNRSLPDGNGAAAPPDRRSSRRAVLGRRSYLKRTGALAAAAVGVTGVAGATSDERTDADDDPEVIEIDYDAYADPSEVYTVWTGDTATASFVNEPANSGGQVLEMSVNGGDSWGTNAIYSLPDHGYGQPSVVSQRHSVYLSDNWEMAPDDVCRITATGFNTAAGDAGSAVRGPPSGTDGWSSVVCVTDRENPPEGSYHLATYTYHIDGTNSGEFEVTDTPIPVGEWVELETTVEMNTYEDGEANADGVVRCWLDGELAYERENYRWTTTDEQAVEYVGPLVRYGGGEVAPHEQAFYYDDHEIVVNGRSSGRGD